MMNEKNKHTHTYYLGAVIVEKVLYYFSDRLDGRETYATETHLEGFRARSIVYAVMGRWWVGVGHGKYLSESGMGIGGRGWQERTRQGDGGMVSSYISYYRTHDIYGKYR